MMIPIALALALLGLFVGLFVTGRRQARARVRTCLKQSPLLVDVRSPTEFHVEHIDGAINIPAEALQSRLDELGDRGRPIGLYCQSGARASVAELTLIAYGFTKVTNLGALALVRSVVAEH